MNALTCFQRNINTKTSVLRTYTVATLQDEKQQHKTSTKTKMEREMKKKLK